MSSEKLTGENWDAIGEFAKAFVGAVYAHVAKTFNVCAEATVSPANVSSPVYWQRAQKSPFFSYATEEQATRLQQTGASLNQTVEGLAARMRMLSYGNALDIADIFIDVARNGGMSTEEMKQIVREVKKPKIEGENQMALFRRYSPKLAALCE